MKVCIVTVGNEILKGRTVNTNAAHIGRALTFAGHSVSLGITVPDSMDDIVWAFRTAMDSSDIIVSSGGLGPTYDDMTIDGVSRALNIELELNPDAEKMIRSKYESMGVELTPARIKMAYLPKGSRAIPNSVGTAPGLFLKFNGKTLIVLPGVPAEMKAILEEILPEISAKDYFYYEESVIIKGIMESAIAPVVERIMKKYGGRVYIKSHPRKAEDKSPEVEIEVSGSSSRESEATDRVRSALEDVKAESSKLKAHNKKEGEEIFH